MSVDSETIGYGGRTAWARNLAAPVRSFLSTEEGGAIVMLGAAIVALVWANAPGWHSYESVWTTKLEIRIGSAGIGTDLRHWVNEAVVHGACRAVARMIGGEYRTGDAALELIKTMVI